MRTALLILALAGPAFLQSKPPAPGASDDDKPLKIQVALQDAMTPYQAQLRLPNLGHDHPIIYARESHRAEPSRASAKSEMV